MNRIKIYPKPSLRTICQSAIHHSNRAFQNFLKQMGFRYLLFIVLLPASLYAQNRTGGRINDPGRSNNYQQLQQQFNQASAVVSGLIVTEGAIDAEAYIVGPGDQFALTIGGATPLQQIVPVTAEGNLLLFDVGSVAVAGMTLALVREKAIDALRVQYENVHLDVNLVQPRRFYVHLSGAFPEPGRYLMLPLARLDDAVQQAFAAQAAARPDPSAGNEIRIVGSATSEVPATQPGFKPSLRNVKLTRRDGSEHNIDLFKYYTHGDLDQNPYLQEGDVVYLGSYHENRETIQVTGDVASPGKIEFREGDTVLDALNMVAGSADLSNIQRVRLTRRNPGAGITTPVDLDVQAMQSGQSPSVSLMAGDYLNIEMVETASAAVYGQVQYPGSFPIESGQTSLKAVIELAGGLKPDANLNLAYLERRISHSPKPDAANSSLDFFERAYFRSSLAANRIPINIESALQPDAAPILLYNGDVVVFPRDEQAIHVTGNAVNPGYIPFVEGQPATYYINQAGGAAQLTTGIYIFEVGSGEVHTNTSVILKPGDTVFINRETITDSPELQSLLLSDQISKRQTRIATTQTIITGITALVGIINTYLLIRDRLNQ